MDLEGYATNAFYILYKTSQKHKLLNKERTQFHLLRGCISIQEPKVKCLFISGHEGSKKYSKDIYLNEVKTIEVY